MYEENCKPLARGDASVVFAGQLAKMKIGSGSAQIGEVTPETVIRWADKSIQPHFSPICRRLLLPGSGIRGVDHLASLIDLALQGQPCLVCLNHRSNFDVPTLYTLMEDNEKLGLFDKLIWIAGRKLEEDVGMTSRLVQCFNRVIVTPHGWFAEPHSDDELHQARRINIAAERAIAHLRYEGWAFALFPTGTRVRCDNASSNQAITETYNYLRMFDYMVLCHIEGCTLPVSKDRDLTHEIPQLDKVVYSFGPVHRTDQWIATAVKGCSKLDQRAAVANAIMDDIQALQR